MMILRVNFQSKKLGGSLVWGYSNYAVNLEPNSLLTPSQIQIFWLKIHPLVITKYEYLTYSVFEASFCTWDVVKIPDRLSPGEDISILHFRNHFSSDDGVSCRLLNPENNKTGLRQQISTRLDCLSKGLRFLTKSA